MSPGGTAGGRGTVVVLDGRLHPYHDFSVEREAWESAGIVVELGECRSEDDVVAAASHTDAAVFWGLTVPVTRQVIERLARCRLLSRYGLGYDSIDVEAATDNGIVVAIPAEYCVGEVAEHAAALLFSLARRLPFLSPVLQSGGWRRPGLLTANVQRLSTATVGLLGLGRTGRRLAEIMRPVAGRIIAHDPYVAVDEAAQLGVALVPLEVLLVEADFLSIHAPLNDETRGMLDGDALGMMKPTAYLINTSRGAIVEEAALAEALRVGRLAGAGLDVFAVEPLPPDSALRGLDNVLLTPHFAGNSEQAKTDLYAAMTEMVVDVLEGRWPRHVVNPAVVPRVPLQPR